MKNIFRLLITSALLVGFPLVSAADAPTTPDSSTDSSESVEILKITRHPPTKLSPKLHQNTSALTVSGTGVVAAFYGYDGAPRFFRTSTDGGLTWNPEQASPDQLDGGQASATLSGGGSIKPVGMAQPVEGEPGWFESKMIHFNDDFSEHVIQSSRIHMPGAITQKVEGRSYVWYWPGFCCTIATLDGGDLITTLYGLFDGDAVGSGHGSRVIVVRSSDQGRTWLYQGTVTHEHQDPNPELPGMFAGFTES